MVKKVYVHTIGTAVPLNRIGQETHYSILKSANGMSRQEKLRLRKIYAHSGIDYRFSVLDDFGKTDQSENILFHPGNHHPSVPISKRMNLFEKFAADLCAVAARECFDELPALAPSQITHLITFSCTGMSAPGLDMQLVDKLSLQLNVERTCINFMGCYAGINALKVAYHIARSDENAIILLAGVELCSLHYQESDEQDQVVANALFADGAATCIVSAKKIQPGNSKRNLLLQNFYSEFDPKGTNEMVWRIGDYGFDLRLSAYVPALIQSGIYSLTEKLFQKAKLKREEIDFYALHPGGIKILEACEEALQISKQQNEISYRVLRDFGNMSSVTIFFVLKEYLKKFTARDSGKKMLACAFGPGLTMESMIAEIA